MDLNIYLRLELQVYGSMHDFYSIYLVCKTISSQFVLDAMEYKGKGTMYCLLTV